MEKKILFTLVALMLASAVSAQHDQYGNWLWPGGMDVPNPIWLPSTSSNKGASYLPTTLYLEFGNISEMRFVLEGDAAPNAVDYYENKPIAEMELSFDNGDFMYYKFVRVEESKGFPEDGIPPTKTFQFVISDRYRQTISFDATNMLKQMANKRTASIRYKVKNGAMKTETFKLEGLEAILDIIFNN